MIGLAVPGRRNWAAQEQEMQRNPALKEFEESSRERWELIWVVTPADGPCIGSVSLFIFRESNEQCEERKCESWT